MEGPDKTWYRQVSELEVTGLYLPLAGMKNIDTLPTLVCTRQK